MTGARGRSNILKDDANAAVAGNVTCMHSHGCLWQISSPPSIARHLADGVKWFSFAKLLDLRSRIPV